MEPVPTGGERIRFTNRKENVMEEMEIWGLLSSLSIGLGLSAACGFRIFVPLLAMSIASKAGYLSLAESFDWMGSTAAMITFASATVLEVSAYYVPWVDNLLDTVAAPTAVVAGVIATGSQVGDMNPLLGWSLAIIGGGGLAGVFQGLTTVTRQISSFATAGFGNPIVSTLEGGASILMSILAIVIAPVAVLLILAALYFGVKKVFFRRQAAAAAAEPVAV
jgi:hypothetical protein